MWRRATLATRDKWLGLALLAPSATLFAVLIAYPFAQALFLSFTRTHTISQRSRFVGFDNYLAIATDAEFWSSLANTFIWTGGTLTLQIVLGVAAALVLHQRLPLRSLARALVLFPYLLPMVVAVLIWRWVFNDLYGILNHLFIGWGLIQRPIDWLGSMPNAMISLILVGAWKYFPFVVIAVLARLQTIPEALYEAAKMDGAGPWSRFWDITMPQLRSVLVVVTLLRAIWDFKEFDLIFLLTGGGPVSETQTLPLLVYKSAFALFNLGMASAVAVVMLIIMLAFMLLYLRVYGREEREG
ncbi:MAG: sugar ABC transporter permease [Alphaproteobacteria bacterium]|nr:sugar ABC transporter permease [Alphaproteobacteria bacterium]